MPTASPSRSALWCQLRTKRRALDACLTALHQAVHEVAADVTVHVVVVLDSCTDESHTVALNAARGLRLHLLSVCVGQVGAARHAGVRWLLDQAAGCPVWVATTDADSTVPRNWLKRQLELSAAGAQLVAGRSA